MVVALDSAAPLAVASTEEVVLAPSYKRRKSKPTSVFIKVRVKVMVLPAGATKVVEGQAQLLP